jgi:hypothetical protein
MEQAAYRLGQAREMEMALEDGRALVKRDAIQRIITSGAASSATAAEKIVEQDAEYAAHRLKQREAVIATQLCWASYEAARIRAWALVREPQEVA